MAHPQTVVVKIGTSSLTKPNGHLAIAVIASLVETLCALQASGHQIILVSSGAVGVGCARLNLSERPKTISMKQAVAAVGQGRLMRVYDDFFTTLGQPIAQVLLTRSDLVQRSRYVNSYRTFCQLLQLGVIPIVNENDTVAIEELKFGDNDTLSAQVASLVGADWLFLLTDVDRLYSADPRYHPEAQPIHIVERIEQLEDLQVSIGDRGSQWGTGGMLTKIEAARIAANAGVRTVITDGQHPENLSKILNGESLGTQFSPKSTVANARKRWIAQSLIPAGKLYLDDGAVKAIQTGGKSLLPAGITEVEGEFEPRSAVQICDAQGQEIARGIVNYSHTELTKILGHQSEDIAKILGYVGVDTAVHRDNMVISASS
ncbi:glutamate 5-kinase [Oscillatoria sp. CS-180]|uniref:glutamate 5-kinase n=1 Tax=Oscillatoria sp. CS-180 TaxID=3021720 RepID=UPI00232AAE55|nr:glutamate 5-kinase [Oscillatoria sp. CS-180]MDB9528619.1 glutamate 5-kinase [Oscillatoria sp. CS-180]